MNNQLVNQERLLVDDVDGGADEFEFMKNRVQRLAQGFIGMVPPNELAIFASGNNRCSAAVGAMNWDLFSEDGNLHIRAILGTGGTRISAKSPLNIYRMTARPGTTRAKKWETQSTWIQWEHAEGVYHARQGLLDILLQAFPMIRSKIEILGSCGKRIRKSSTRS